jgi:hypothetical protein
MPIPCIGVDPGKNGGFAFIDPAGVGGALKFPRVYPGDDKSELDFAALEAYFADLRFSGVVHAYCESMVRYIGSAQTGSSVAPYAFSAGVIRGILEAQKWQIHEVWPSAWQRTFTDKRVASFVSKTQWKNHLKEIATKYFTYLKVTLSISDALLIAKYGFTELNDC